MSDLFLHPIFTQIPNIAAYTTKTLGGISGGNYASLNLGLHVGDTKESVITNRNLVCKALNIDNTRIATARQVHGDTILEIGESDLGKGFENIDEALVCDGFITDVPNAALAINIADCAAVLFSDKKGKVIAALHSGRAGCAQNISGKCVDLYKNRYGIPPEEILVSVSPSIKSCCYEVGEEIVEGFKKYAEGVFERGGRYYLDIQNIIHAQLLASGIPPQNIETLGICTCCEGKEELFSYRRENVCGRMWGLIIKR